MRIRNHCTDVAAEVTRQLTFQCRSLVICWEVEASRLLPRQLRARQVLECGKAVRLGPSAAFPKACDNSKPFLGRIETQRHWADEPSVCKLYPELPYCRRRKKRWGPLKIVVYGLVAPVTSKYGPFALVELCKIMPGAQEIWRWLLS